MSHKDVHVRFTTDERPELTPAELACLAQCGALAGMLGGIVGHGRTRNTDLSELFGHVHAIQQAVMSQLAARTYPDRFRLLGEVLASD